MEGLARLDDVDHPVSAEHLLSVDGSGRVARDVQRRAVTLADHHLAAFDADHLSAVIQAAQQAFV